MKIFIRFVLICMLVAVAAPSFASEAVQVYTCEIFDEGATEQQIIDAAEKWLKAAKGMKGGANFEIELYFPMAADMGESDFLLVIRAPSFKEWGEFHDGYEGSPANKVDKEFDAIVDCPSSKLWESFDAK